MDFEVAKKYFNFADQLRIQRGTDEHLRQGPFIIDIIRQIENFVNDKSHKNEIIQINLTFKAEKEENVAVDMFRKYFKNCLVFREESDQGGLSK